jgi:hypothetical protein
MPPVLRLAYTNLVQQSGGVITASSYNPAFPPAWLRDPLRSKGPRTKAGWNVRVGDNDKLDFKEAGTARVATLTAGNYATAALYAAMVQAAMNAAPGAVNTYTVTYAASVYTIARATGASALDLPFLTGANVLTSAHRGLGFTSTDKTGATTYAAEGVSYHTPEWFKVDLGAASSASRGVVINHNLGTGGTITLQGNGTDAWGAPAVSQVLAGDATIRIADFTPSAQALWRIVIDDVGNPNGYSEVGKWFAGPYSEPASAYTVDNPKDWAEYSTVQRAMNGAPQQSQHDRARLYVFNWQEIPQTDVEILEAVAAATPVGKCFFLSPDFIGNPNDTVYGFRPETIAVEHSNVSMSFEEALG